jgi:hypothetical protein
VLDQVGAKLSVFDKQKTGTQRGSLRECPISDDRTLSTRIFDSSLVQYDFARSWSVTTTLDRGGAFAEIGETAPNLPFGDANNRSNFSLRISAIPVVGSMVVRLTFSWHCHNLPEQTVFLVIKPSCKKQLVGTGRHHRVAEVQSPKAIVRDGLTFLII